MQRFSVYRNGAPAKEIDLAGAYAFGQDNVPVRADLSVEDGRILCSKGNEGACGLALLWDADRAGRFLLPTGRLPDRGKDYNLNVELARAQVGRIAQKREDWGLMDHPAGKGVNGEFDEVRRAFVDSLKTPDGGAAAAKADEALSRSIALGEKMSLIHADLLLERRVSSESPELSAIGTAVNIAVDDEAYSERILPVCDFITIPMPWKTIVPREDERNFSAIDPWVNWAAKNHCDIHTGPLLSFEESQLPEWLYLWDDDYESVRDWALEHIGQVVQRYRKHVKVWNVVSSLHAVNTFDLSFDELMELTRMSCRLVKRLAPNAQVMIDLTSPWGEYYARNQRTIPPLLYADMAAQSGVKFDSLGVQFCMGVPTEGLYMRHMLQIATLLDEFVAFGKPIHVSACEVPSDVSPDKNASVGQDPVERAGRWRTPWSQQCQAEWLSAFFRLAFARPYVESICWRDLTDRREHFLPHGGLCTEKLQPKAAYGELQKLRAMFRANHGQAGDAGGNGPTG